MFEHANRLLDTAHFLAHAARQPVVLAQSIEHRTANALHRVGFELGTHAVLESIHGVEQADQAVLDQIIDFDAGRQPGHQQVGYPLDQREVAGNLLVLGQRALGGIHDARDQPGYRVSAAPA